MTFADNPLLLASTPSSAMPKHTPYVAGTEQLHEAAKFMTEVEGHAKRLSEQMEKCKAKVHHYMKVRDGYLRGPPCLKTQAVHADECARQFLSIVERLEELCHPSELQKQAFSLRADLLARIERALAESGAAVDAVSRRHLPLDDILPPMLTGGGAVGDFVLGDETSAARAPTSRRRRKSTPAPSAKKGGKKKGEEEKARSSMLMHIASKYDTTKTFEIDHTDDLCEICGEQKRIIYASSTRMCPKCAVVERYTTDAMLTAGQSSGAGAEEASAAAAAAAMRQNKPSKNRDTAPVRTRIRACLVNAQWKETVKVPVHLIQWLKQVCVSYGYTDLTALDPGTVEFIMRAVVWVNAPKGSTVLEEETEKIALKMMEAEGMDPKDRDLAKYPVLKRDSMQRYYQYSTQVTCFITGKSPPVLPPEVEDELLEKTLAADRHLRVRRPDVYNPSLHRAIIHFVAEWMGLHDFVPWLSLHMANATMERIRPAWEALVRTLFVQGDTSEEQVGEYMARLASRDLFRRRQLPSMVPKQGLQAQLWARQLSTRVPEGWQHAFLRFGTWPYISPHEAPDAEVLDIASYLEPQPGLFRIPPHDPSPPPAVPIILPSDDSAPFLDVVRALQSPVCTELEVSRRGDPTLRICVWNVDGMSAHLDLVEAMWLHGIDAEKSGTRSGLEPPDVVCLAEIKLGQNFNDVYNRLQHSVPYLLLNPCRSKNSGGHQHGSGLMLRERPLRTWTEMNLPEKLKDSLGLTDEEWVGARDMVELEGRVTAAELEDVVVVAVYVPISGSTQHMRRLKLRTQVWDPVFRAWCARLQHFTKKPVAVCGDWNVVRRTVDMHKPKWGNAAGCMPAERSNAEQWIKEGWMDTWPLLEQARLVPGAGAGYTLWPRRGDAAFDGNKGSRTDAVLIRNHGEASHLLNVQGGHVAKQYIAATRMDHAPYFVHLVREPYEGAA